MKGETGFRVELHHPSAPQVGQAFKIGSFALTSQGAIPPGQAGWSDIDLIDSDGLSETMTQLVPQLFLPPGQLLWPGQTAQPGESWALQMHVNGKHVSSASNIWNRVLQSGGQPSQKLPIKDAWDGKLLGNMQIMSLPPESVASASGIIFVMPGSDAVFNLQPEVSVYLTLHAD